MFDREDLLVSIIFLIVVLAAIVFYSLGIGDGKRIASEIEHDKTCKLLGFEYAYPELPYLQCCNDGNCVSGYMILSSIQQDTRYNDWATRQNATTREKCEQTIVGFE